MHGVMKNRVHLSVFHEFKVSLNTFIQKNFLMNNYVYVPMFITIFKMLSH